MSKLISYYEENGDRFIEGLKELLRIPSISALPAHQADVRRAADFLVDDLRRMGLDSVELIEGDGNPIIYAEKMDSPGKPTVVLYGHYDVQPPDPIDEWKSPPFEPTVRGDDLFARGAVDDKGQMWILLKAVEGLLAVDGKLPVNVKVLIEGEEETDGGMIAKYLAEHGSELEADAALICDTEMFTPGLPTITTGVRGIIYCEIDVTAAKTDLHSGNYGGVAPNPMQAMAEIITGLKDKDGRILIPGFYDDVQAPTEAELAAWKQLPFDADEYREAEIGCTELTGESGFGPLERIWARPALDVHGIRGGFTGDGAKTVIPAKALAKVSMRLVPTMDADKIAKAFCDHVRALTPKGTVVEPCVLAASPSAVVSTDSPFVVKAAEALKETFAKDTVYIRCGGSIPVVGLFSDAGISPVLIGFGLPDDNLHAPNEKFHIPNFHKGVQAIGRYLRMLGE